LIKPNVTSDQVARQRANSAGLLLVLAALLLLVPSCTRLIADPARDTITVGSPALEQAALIYLAGDQGLFARHGLDVVVQDYDSGPAALEALRTRTVDIAATAEYPLVHLILKGESLTVVATTDKFENDYIVALPDSGITTLGDLRGKRVGLTRGTIVEFYLARLLELEGIPAHEVTVVDVSPDSVVAALSARKVDAICAWQPYVQQAQHDVSGAVVLPAQSSQPVFGVLVARQAWVREHGDRLTRFLKALAEAEEQLARDPEGAQAIVRRRLGYDAAYLASVWPQHRFGLSLDQPLVIAMKDEAQWMIRSKLTSATQLPDFAAHIESAALEAAKPGSANLVP
jgi:ABC-type nitrate/sulfonate/bicarbonate transport system substrate-binding protein